jgi:hypothetical protein
MPGRSRRDAHAHVAMVSLPVLILNLTAHGSGPSAQRAVVPLQACKINISGLQATETIRSDFQTTVEPFPLSFACVRPPGYETHVDCHARCYCVFAISHIRMCNMQLVAMASIEV